MTSINTRSYGQTGTSQTSQTLSNEKALQNYKRKLQKEFSTRHNRRIFLDANKSSNFETRTNPDDHNVDSIIQVNSVTFNIKEDGANHHTGDFDLMQEIPATPVFRRGQPFSLNVSFNRQYHPTEDLFYLQAEYGPIPSVENGTKYQVSLSSKEAENEDHWEMWSKDSSFQKCGGSEYEIQIQTPRNCQVGLWKFSIITYKLDTPGQSRYDFPQEIYILFNPWNKSDNIFLENEAERQEYVLKDSGNIWLGTNKVPVDYPWVFGQFDVAVLPAVVLLLEQSEVPHVHRGSPILISRAISAMMQANSYEDNGLLVSKWKGHFDDGTKPFAWTGSVSFYNEFLQTGRPVKYAQSWVFSGAITTACRALGIPCRPVTCYVCAPITNNSLTVDKFFSKTGNLIEGGTDGDCDDSIWNFHCWNEVWMKRPDLPEGYDGWQAIDGTPQEKSNRKYKTGPASLKAIKQGNTGFKYDTGFLFSGVNAELCYFVEDSNSPWGFTRTTLDAAHIERRIVTQSLEGSQCDEKGLQEITAMYKNVKGTDSESVAVSNAFKFHPRSKMYDTYVKSKDVFFKLHEVDAIFVGDLFSVILVIENQSSAQRTVKTNLHVDWVSYTGRLYNHIKQATEEIRLQPNEAKPVRVIVNPEEYTAVMHECSFQVQITAVSSVLETDQLDLAQVDFEIMRKRLDIKVPEQVKVGNIIEIQFTFTNPLTEPLTNCELTIEGPGLSRPKTLELSNVPPKERMEHRESLLPSKAGPRQLVATLSSDQLTGVRGSKTIIVQP